MPWQRFVIWPIGHHDALDDSLITISDRHLIDRCPDASFPRVQTASPSKHETAVGQTSSATICCAAVDICVFLLLMCSRNDDVDRLFGSHQAARSETPMVLGAIRSCWRLHRPLALARSTKSHRSFSPTALNAPRVRRTNLHRRHRPQQQTRGDQIFLDVFARHRAPF